MRGVGLRRAGLAVQFMRKLLRLADEFGVAVVITNQAARTAPAGTTPPSATQAQRGVGCGRHLALRADPARTPLVLSSIGRGTSGWRRLCRSDGQETDWRAHYGTCEHDQASPNHRRVPRNVRIRRRAAAAACAALSGLTAPAAMRPIEIPALLALCISGRACMGWPTALLRPARPASTQPYGLAPVLHCANGPQHTLHRRPYHAERPRRACGGRKWPV
jgi:hypothetical protein